jgi:hemoglobin-like flavoprotein
MALDPKALRSSFALIVERAPDMTARFYDVLFARYPSARPLFSHAPAARAKQADMLQRALVAVLEHLEDAAWLGEQLAALGAKHVGYGVRPEMYAWVGDALLATLGEIGGSEWTDELQAQWSEAYGVIVSLMRRGEALEAAPTRGDAQPGSV